MSTQPEVRVERGPVTQNEAFAIGMAKLLEREGKTIAAAELRRLHQFAEDQIGRATAAEAALQMTKATHALKIAAVEAQRDALLEALRAAVADWDEEVSRGRWLDAARAAIAKAEGEQA